ncbi:MAG: hypothetical protein B6I24_11220 [Bacteroidetes bacterium 4572_128]|nr:MAG: hypothetical protein B6I24_11220 [Bacteroidetes bacterium 4572_128]
MFFLKKNFFSKIVQNFNIFYKIGVFFILNNLKFWRFFQKTFYENLSNFYNFQKRKKNMRFFFSFFKKITYI